METMVRWQQKSLSLPRYCTQESSHLGTDRVPNTVAIALPKDMNDRKSKR